MTDPPQSSIVQLGGKLAEQAIAAFITQPVLLLIVLLNITFAALAAWFLLSQESYRHTERLQFIELFRACALGGNA